MAEMVIRLECDPKTGKKNVLIKLMHEPDALPHEHEQAHRALVDQLIDGGIIAANELGEIIIQRDDQHAPHDAPSSQPNGAEQSEPQTDAQSGS